MGNPDGAGFELVKALSGHLSIPTENIVLGNGSDDIIAILMRALLLPGDNVIIPDPSFLMYGITAQTAGAKSIAVPLKDYKMNLDEMADCITDRTKLIFICNPNNPTGTVVKQSEFDAFLRAVPDHVTIVVDEAYVEFVREPSSIQGLQYITEDRPIVLLRTFSKIYGLAGLRIGYGLMPEYLADLLNRVRQPFNVNLLAQAAAVGALRDTDFLDRTLEMVHSGMDYLQAELKNMRIKSYPSEANFFLIDVQQDAASVFNRMLKQGVIIRSMKSYGYPNFIRVSIGQPHENDRFLKALASVMEEA